MTYSAYSAGADVGVQAARFLRQLGSVEMHPGLTDAELWQIERTYGFQFADDHRAFLAEALPVRAPALEHDPARATVFGFPDWRHGDCTRLQAQIDFPLEGLREDILRGHWPKGWGQRPAHQDRLLEVVGRYISDVPQLVPIYAHRYLPSGRGTSVQPVLSVFGTDIVCYGSNLLDYVQHEFAREAWERAHPHGVSRPKLAVNFWSQYV